MFHNNDIQINFTFEERERSEYLYETFLNGDDYIKRWQKANDRGSLDAVGTALGASAVVALTAMYRPDVNYAELRVREDKLWEIRTTPRSSIEQRRFLISHELGHIALYMRLFETYGSLSNEVLSAHEIGNQDIENLCDFFSLRMLGYEDIPNEIDWNNMPYLQ